MRLTSRIETRLYAVICIMMLFVPFASSQTGLFTHIFNDSSNQQLHLKDSAEVFYDAQGTLTLKDIMDPTKAIFKRQIQSIYSRKEDAVWVRFALVNAGSTQKAECISFCTLSDSVDLYAVDTLGNIFAQHIGTAVDDQLRVVPTVNNSLIINLTPEERMLYYVKVKFKTGTESLHFDHLFIEPHQPLLRKLTEQFMVQCLYVGIMLVFFVVSLLMYFIFKERIFNYLGLIALFFALYFLKMSGVFDTFIHNTSRWERLNIGNLFITGVNIAVFLFVRKYMNLRTKNPKFHLVLLILTIVLAFFTHIARLIIPDWRFATAQNIMMLVWIVLIMIPVIQQTVKGDKQARILLISIGFLFFGSVLLVLSLLDILPSNGLTRYSIQVGTIVFSGMLFFGLFDKISSIRKDRLAMSIEKQKSDALLDNILPTHVANQLKETGVAEAQKFQNASVLFTDFKGFTELSGKMKPKELIAELNLCFSAFDAICERYNVEKIKTIGDAFMAVGGLPVAYPESTANTLLAALEMIRFIEERKVTQTGLNGHYFEMRVGIHTGPLVAGIIGTKKLQYDIWGDTVNTAARMESSGEAGRVNISEATYLQVQSDPRFIFESRGKVLAKGKGEMEMFFVRKKNDESRAGKK